MPPELAAAARAAGPYVDRAPRATAYPVDRLGGLCRGCKQPIPAVLDVDRHPTCEPDWPDLVAESKRAARRTTPTKGTT